MHRALLIALALAPALGLPAHAAPPAMPRAVTSFGAAVCAEAAWIYGGHMGKAHDYSRDTVSGALRKLSLSKLDAWEEGAGGTPVQSPGLAAWEGKLYLAGGMQPRNESGAKAWLVSLDRTAVYDPAAGAWAPLPALPQPRSSHAVAVLDGKLYAVGGWPLDVGGPTPVPEKKGAGKAAHGGYHDAMAVLDLRKPAAGWKGAPQPFKRRALAAVAHQGKLWCLGGFTEENEVSAAVDVFDPATGSWTAGPEIPGDERVKAFGCAACETESGLCVSPHGGKVYRLTLDGRSWVQCGALAKPRYFHALLPLAPGKLLAIGGTQNGVPMDDVEVVAITPAN